MPRHPGLMAVSLYLYGERIATFVTDPGVCQQKATQRQEGSCVSKHCSWSSGSFFALVCLHHWQTNVWNRPLSVTFHTHLIFQSSFVQESTAVAPEGSGQDTAPATASVEVLCFSLPLAMTWKLLSEKEFLNYESCASKHCSWNSGFFFMITPQVHEVFFQFELCEGRVISSHIHLDCSNA